MVPPEPPSIKYSVPEPGVAFPERGGGVIITLFEVHTLWRFGLRGWLGGDLRPAIA